jgi:predicted outer membrane repeat protein
LSIKSCAAVCPFRSRRTTWSAQHGPVVPDSFFASRQRPQTVKHGFRPRLEALEERYAPAALTVTNVNDAGLGSLRATVSAANNGDTIQFAPSLNGQTIGLSSGEISLTKSLTIDGQNNGISISSSNTSRVFHGSDATLSEMISNLSFFFNKASQVGQDFGQGGAIYAFGNLTLTSDFFTENTAASNGGAVAVYQGASTTVTNCTFSSNASEGDGGAISTQNPLTVTGGAFSGNRAQGYGGAIDWQVSGGILDVNYVTFKNNSSQRGGAVNCNGAITQGTAGVRIAGSLFSGNQIISPSNGGQGGGLYAGFATSNLGAFTLVVQNDTFYQNTADHGGGIALDNTADTPSRLRNFSWLTSLTVTGNTGKTDGGGLWLRAGVYPFLRNNIVAGNMLGAGVQPANGPDIFGTLISKGYNLIGETDGSGANWLPTDRKGTSANPLDPGLDPNGPTFNGGPTNTIGLVNGSPAYQNGDPLLGGKLDQRSYKRPTGPNVVTIGAYDPDAT